MIRTTPLHLQAIAADGARRPVVVELGPLASGGDAAIHRVQGDAGLVAKLYHDPAAEPRRRAKLDAMLAAPPDGRETQHDGRRVVQLAWPEAVLGFEPGVPLGYLMPRLDSAKAPVLEVLLSARARRTAGLPGDVRFRVAAARNLAAAVASLHGAGHHVIDLKPANVHVTREAFVAVLDCDGFSIQGPDGERFPAHQYTDGYLAPEAIRDGARPEDLGEPQDRFALAVIVFQLLNGGLHPFQGVPRSGATVPTTNGERIAAGLYPYGLASAPPSLAPSPLSLHSSFDDATRSLFDRSFASSSPADRPSASEWSAHLGELLDHVLRPCGRDPDHARFGDRACGACARTTTTTARRPSPTTGGGLPLPGLVHPGPASSGAASSTTPLAPPAPSMAPSSRPRAGAATPSAPAPAAVASSLGTRIRQGVRSWRQARATPAAPQAPAPSATSAAPATSNRGEILKGLAMLLGVVAGVVGLLAAIVWVSSWGPRTESWDSDLHKAITGFAPDVEMARRALDHGASVERPDATVFEGVGGAGTLPLAYGPIDTHIGFPQGQEVRTGPWRTLAAPLERDASYLFDIVEQNRPELAVLLLNRGADTEATDSHARTPLMMASIAMAPTILLSDAESHALLRAADGREILARLTVENASVDVSVRDPPDVEATLAAIDERLRDPDAYVDPWDPNVRQIIENAAVLRALLSAGAETEARDRWGRTALAYAAAYGHVPALRILLNAGADPNAADAAGVTPLMVVADQTVFAEDDTLAVELATALLRAGADPAAEDAAGRTARDYIDERWKTRNGKRRVSDEILIYRVPHTELRGPGQLDSLLAAAGAPAPTPNTTPADIGDGGTAFASPIASSTDASSTDASSTDASSTDASSPGVDDLEPLPWTKDGTMRLVTCDGVPTGTVTADLTIGRTDVPGQGQVIRVSIPDWNVRRRDPPPSGDQERFAMQQTALRCTDQLFEGYADKRFDLRDEPERWATGRIEVLAMAPPTEGAQRPSQFVVPQPPATPPPRPQ